MPTLARLALVLPCASLVALPASGQAQLAWQQNVSSGAFDDPARAVVFGPGGEAVIAGRLRVPGGVNTAAWLVSRGADGAALGSHQWPPVPAGSYAWIDADVSASGDIAVVGAQPGGSMVARCTPSCAFVWGPLTLPAPFASATAVLYDASGDLLVAGRTSTADVFVARYSSGGTLVDSTIWAHPAGGDDHASALAVDAAGHVLVVGVADYGVVTRTYVLKLTPALDTVWSREQLGVAEPEPGPDLALDDSGSAHVACSVALQGGPFQRVFSLWKLLPDGTTAWLAQTSDATYPLGNAERVAIDPFGNAAVAGRRFGASEVVALVRSYGADGSLRWSHALGGPESLYRSVAADAGGDVLVAGWIGSPQRATSARFDRDGNLRWSHVDADWYGQGAPAIGVGVAPGGGAVLGTTASISASPRFLRCYRLDAAVFPTCAGDGSLTPCPCGNESDPSERAGCVHSLGSGGRLEGEGYASLTADTLALVGSDMPNSFALYFQGSAVVAPATFGDGLRCAGGSLVRLATQPNTSGGSQFPGPGDPALSVAGGVGGAETRWYQVWFRDPSPHCTADTFNATNALRVSWVP